MAGSKPRSESLAERSAERNRRCVAVTDEYNTGDTVMEVKEESSTNAKFGAVVRSEKEESSVSKIAGGAKAFCENVGDMIKTRAKKKEYARKRAERILESKRNEEAEKADFLAGRITEKEPLEKPEREIYIPVEVKEEPKGFGEVVRKREGAYSKKKNDSSFAEKMAGVLSDKSKTKALSVAAVLLVAVIFVTVVFANFANVYEYKLGDATIRVENPERVQAVLNKINEEFKLSFGDDAVPFDLPDDFDKRFAKRGGYSSDEEIRDAILKTNSELYEMHVIYIGETAIAGVSSEEDAKRAIEEFKNQFTGGSEDVEYTTDKKMYSVCEMAPASLLMSDVDMVVKMLNGSKSKQVYVVEEGDVLGSIAYNFDMSVSELKALNNLEDDELDIGDELLVAAYEPIINVTTVQTVTVKEVIAYEEERVDDSSRYVGSNKVTTYGEEGEKEIVKTVTKVNGKVENEEILSETVIKEPVTQVMLVGTKKRPAGVGTANFITPARGYISSRYGSRSRGFHTGLDIAGSYGSPIVAADHGKVIFAGWSGGYGYMVKIDHQNGYVTYYAHNSKLTVKAGDIVSKGEVIAYMGSTGNSTGNHCHFEILKNGSTQNPEKYI